MRWSKVDMQRMYQPAINQMMTACSNTQQLCLTPASSTWKMQILQYASGLFWLDSSQGKSPLED